MELKGLDRLERVVNEYLDLFDCQGRMELDFAYYYESETVAWSIFMADTSDRCFNRFVNERYPHIEADIFLWSLLHEVGHHCTHHLISNRDYEISEVLKEVAEERLASGEIDEYQCYVYYFTAPEELEATSWAADYMLHNAEEVAAFWQRFCEAYDNFLRENNVENF